MLHGRFLMDPFGNICSGEFSLRGSTRVTNGIFLLVLLQVSWRKHCFARSMSHVERRKFELWIYWLVYQVHLYIDVKRMVVKM